MKNFSSADFAESNFHGMNDNQLKENLILALLIMLWLKEIFFIQSKKKNE